MKPLLLALCLILAFAASATEPRLFEWKNSNGKSVKGDFRGYFPVKKTVALFYNDRLHEVSWDKMAKESVEQARLLSFGVQVFDLVSQSPWDFGFLDGGKIWFTDKGKVLIKDRINREAYGTYKIKESRVVLDTNTGDKVYLCEIKAPDRISAKVANDERKKSTLRPLSKADPRSKKQKRGDEFLKEGR